MKKTKTVGNQKLPAKCFAYVPDPDTPSTWKLPIYKADGSPDRERLPKAYAAVFSNYRGEKAQIPSSARAGVIRKLKSAYSKAGMDWPGAKSKESEIREFTFAEGVAPLVEGEGEPDGKKWCVTLIKAGLSKNRNYYPQSVLEKAAPLFEGVKAFDRSDFDHATGGGESVRNIVGWFSESRYESGRIKATFNILDTAKWLSDMLLEAYAAKKHDLFGLSIVAMGDAKIRRHEGQEVRWVEALTEAYSVDPVVNPSAGGKFDRLAATDISDMEDLLMFKKLIEKIQALRPQLLDGKDLENITEAELLELLDEALAAQPEKKTEAKQPDNGAVKITEAEQRIANLLAEHEKRLTCQTLLAAKLTESALPDVSKNRLRSMLAGKIFTEAELNETFKAEMDYLAALKPTQVVIPNPAMPGIDTRDKMVAALDGMFMEADQKVGDQKVPRARSIRELYREMTGDFGFTGMVKHAPRLSRLFPEALTSSSWAEILGDSITRKMMAEYMTPGYLADWRKIVSDITPINDFRSNKRMQMGGYGEIPTVAESGTYTELTSPGDQEAYYSIGKKGGLESVTLEMIANDDVGAIKKIPVSLARAALIGLYRTVFDLLVDNDVTTYDSVAWFSDAATRYNKGTTALSQSGLAAIRYAMRSQAAYGETRNLLSLVPKWLVVPNELEETAFKLCKATTTLITAGSTEDLAPNINTQRYSMDYIVVDYFTNAKDYWVFCDPRDCPTIEVGFFQGREEPELFIQDQPTVGSMFTADKITYKIRHIYGVCVLDHRGAYYMDVA